MKTEGWKYLIGTPKWHYFRNGRSLCGGWICFTNSGFDEDEKLNSSSNCKRCTAIRRKELEKENAKNMLQG